MIDKKIVERGYQPSNEGYQPSTSEQSSGGSVIDKVTNGYQPTTSQGSNPTNRPKPPENE